jgi:K+/H+ antiporter YhaU regulatory subunit KhtT
MRTILNQLQQWFVLGVASAGVMISLPVLAQSAPVETPDGTAESIEAPEASPEAASPETQLTAEELAQFASVIPELQTIQEAAQAEVITAVEASGLSPERFNEIAEAQSSPEAAGEVDVSSEEQAAFETVVSEIQTIEQDFLTQREEILQAEGLTVERYREILAAVQEDPALLQQVQEML